MRDVRSIFRAAVGYLREHPEEVVRAARSAVALRVGLPLDALRWLASQAGSKAPKDVQLQAVPPGIRASATIDLMGNEVRASAVVFVEGVRLNTQELRFEVRLAEVALDLLKEAPDSPVATLIKSGALDLRKPGNLAAFMPRRPAFLVEAKDDTIVVDLMKLPQIAGNEKLVRALALLTPVVNIDGIETDWEHLDVVLRAFPGGVDEALQAFRRLL